MNLFKQKNKKIIIKDWADSVKYYIAGWFFALIFFYVMREVGASGLVHINFKLPHFIFLLTVSAVVTGAIFGSLHYFFENYRLRKIPFWKFMIRLFVDQLIIVFFLSIIYYFVLKMLGSSELTFLSFLTSPSTIVYYLYVFLVNSLLSLLLEIGKLLGRGNFYKLLAGNFYSPKEEYRIFMFVDLNSSTTIAEKLGHLAYSSLLKDCFYDLAIVHDYNAGIYQYVGDEAVLTWERSKMKSIMECVDAFWAFNDELSSKAAYYKNKYGIVPEFKAGMSIGMVTVVEIGYMKKEIAYHGNTLNTASRIESLCNYYKEKFLISKKMYDEISKVNSFYSFKKVAETQLRGKQGMTEIYSINKPSELHEMDVVAP
jgi:adenylate cyclase